MSLDKSPQFTSQLTIGSPLPLLPIAPVDTAHQHVPDRCFAGDFNTRIATHNRDADFVITDAGALGCTHRQASCDGWRTAGIVELEFLQFLPTELQNLVLTSQFSEDAITVEVPCIDDRLIANQDGLRDIQRDALTFIDDDLLRWWSGSVTRSDERDGFEFWRRCARLESGIGRVPFTINFATPNSAPNCNVPGSPSAKSGLLPKFSISKL